MQVSDQILKRRRGDGRSVIEKESGSSSPQNKQDVPEELLLVWLQPPRAPAVFLHQQQQATGFGCAEGTGECATVLLHKRQKKEEEGGKVVKAHLD